MLTLDFHFPTGKTVGPGGIFKCSTAQIWGRGNVIKVKPFPLPFQCVFFSHFFFVVQGSASALLWCSGVQNFCKGVLSMNSC